MLWGIAFACIVVLLLAMNQGDGSGDELSYSKFRSEVAAGNVKEVTYDNTSARITGKLDNGDKFHTTGLDPFPTADLELLQENEVVQKNNTPQASSSSSGSPCSSSRC